MPRSSTCACVPLPGGFMPRSALGYITLGAIGVLEAVGLVPPMSADLEEALEELERHDAQCAPGVPTQVNPAKKLATEIGDRVPVIWGAEGIGAVAASRWKAQFNENAKVPAFAASLPELDHNEVVGWSEGHGTPASSSSRSDTTPSARTSPLGSRCRCGSRRSPGPEVREVMVRRPLRARAAALAGR